jgi:HD-GYP domain-containing protein (c-di-GMP phosphodiesterase class II)
VVLQHHERLDGSGYPNALKGDSISDDARILAVADTVDAMVGSRPYRGAFTLEQAFEVLEAGSTTLYDPRMVTACLKIFREDHYTLPVLHNFVQGPAVSNHL